jgi:hypothetical protein
MNEKARNQLLNKGIVYTLRHIRHNIGLDWCTDKRGNKKICNVRITYCDNGNYSKLFKIASDYLSYTGFETKEEWLNAFMGFSKYYYSTFWLYRVEKVI